MVSVLLMSWLNKTVSLQYQIRLTSTLRGHKRIMLVLYFFVVSQSTVSNNYQIWWICSSPSTTLNWISMSNHGWTIVVKKEVHGSVQQDNYLYSYTMLN